MTWGQYDEKGLVLQLIANFEIPIEVQTDPENGFPLRLAPEDQKLQLKPLFSTIFDKMGGFSTNFEFGAKFPELMPYVFPSGPAIVPLPLESGGSYKAFTWADSESPQRQTAKHTTSQQETLDLDFLDHTATEPLERSWVSDSADNSTFGNGTSEGPVSDVGSQKDLCGVHELPVGCSPLMQEVTGTALHKAYEEFCHAFAPFPPFTSVSYEDLF